MRRSPQTLLAHACRCSHPTVLARLKLIRATTGVEPEKLRRFSAHFGKIEDDLSDPRAARLHRRRLISDDDEQEA